MIDWQEGDLTVDGGVNLHYYRSGEGTPVVLAHGASDNGRCWDRVAEVLLANHEVVTYDARYHGKSDAPAGGQLAGGEDLIAVVETLGLDRPAIIGHSMGGRTVAQAAASRPDLFRGVVMEDPPWWAAPPTARRPPGIDTSPLTVEQIAAGGREQNPTWHPDEFQAWAESKKQFRPPAEWMSSFGRSVSAWRELVPQITIPALLICGGNAERGAIVTAEVADEVRSLNPKVEVVTLANAGHNVRREAFDAYIEAITEFLARVE